MIGGGGIGRAPRSSCLPGPSIGQQLEVFLQNLGPKRGNLRPSNSLPISFRAIATNIEDGIDESVDHGSLPECLRASMSVPGVFVLSGKGDEPPALMAALRAIWGVDVARQLGATGNCSESRGLASWKRDQIRSFSASARRW